MNGACCESITSLLSLFSIQIQITWSYVGGAEPGWPHGPTLSTAVVVVIRGTTVVIAVEMVRDAAGGDVWAAIVDTVESSVPAAQVVMGIRRNAKPAVFVAIPFDLRCDDILPRLTQWLSRPEV